MARWCWILIYRIYATVQTPSLGSDVASQYWLLKYELSTIQQYTQKKLEKKLHQQQLHTTGTNMHRVYYRVCIRFTVVEHRMLFPLQCSAVPNNEVTDGILFSSVVCFFSHSVAMNLCARRSWFRWRSSICENEKVFEHAGYGVKHQE